MAGDRIGGQSDNDADGVESGESSVNTLIVIIVVAAVCGVVLLAAIGGATACFLMREKSKPTATSATTSAADTEMSSARVEASGGDSAVYGNVDVEHYATHFGGTGGSASYATVDELPNDDGIASHYAKSFKK